MNFHFYAIEDRTLDHCIYIDYGVKVKVDFYATRLIATLAIPLLATAQNYLEKHFLIQESLYYDNLTMHSL